MTDRVYAKREWFTIQFTGEEVVVGTSDYLREWGIDIDNRGGNQIMYVRGYDGEELLADKTVEADSLARVYLKATELRLYGYHEQTIRYAFPWLIAPVKE